MNFVTYLYLKYKIKSGGHSITKLQLFSEWIARFCLYLFSIFIMYLIISLLPESIQSNMNMYILALFAFISILSISIATKKYYDEYFVSLEREILLIVPVKRSQVILTRYFVIAYDVLFINFIFLFSFVFANYLNGNIMIDIVYATVFQIIATALFASSLAHIIYGFTFLVSKGKGLKPLAYTIMTMIYISVIAIIILSQNYESFFSIDSTWINSFLYLLLQYPELLIQGKFGEESPLLFPIILFIHSVAYMVIAFLLTNKCYKKGMLTLTSRDTNDSIYSDKTSHFIYRLIKNPYLKKDLLYIMRNPKLLSVFISPILFISILEAKNKFLSTGVFFTIFIQIIALTFLSLFIHIIFSDDDSNKELLFTLPHDSNVLYKGRTKLLHRIAFFISSIFITIFSILESIQIEIIVFGIIQLFIITYIFARLVLLSIFKKMIDKSGYWYSGKIVKEIVRYFFTWNILLIILFCVLQLYLMRYIEQQPFSFHASLVCTLTISIVLLIFLKSNRTKLGEVQRKRSIPVKENRKEFD